MISCGILFRAFRVRFESEPGAWLIRDINHGIVWRNAKAREWLGVSSPFEKWEKAIRWAHPEDVTKIEDAISKALKTSDFSSAVVRVAIEPHKVVKVSCLFHAAQCTGCSQRCGLVIYSVALVEERVSQLQDSEESSASL